MILSTAFGAEQMKEFAFLFFFFLFFVQASRAAVIEVKIAENLSVSISSSVADANTDILKFHTELYNIGSTGYTARIRLDINDSKNIHTAWSDEKDLMPGDRKNFDLFWYANSTGKFSVRMRIYYANEILEKNLDVVKNASMHSESIFKISGFRTYDDFVIFDLQASGSAKNISIIPEDFPQGWIFEQKQVDSIDNYGSKTIVLPYKPSLWMPQNVTIMVASDGGKYFSQQSFELKKETDILGVIYYLIDRVKMMIS
jgi:hypothetical protein